MHWGKINSRTFPLLSLAAEANCVRGGGERAAVQCRSVGQKRRSQTSANSGARIVGQKGKRERRKREV